jgi:hypothetical protein
MKNYLYLCLAFSIFHSCNIDQFHHVNELGFNNKEKLNFNQVHVNELLNVEDFIVKDSFIIVRNNRQDSIFMIYSYPDWKSVEAFGMQGRGPDEYVMPRLINSSADNSFEIADIGNHSLTKFDLNSFRSERSDFSFEQFLPQTVIYSPGEKAYFYDSNQQEVLIHRMNENNSSSIIYNFEDLRMKYANSNAYWGFLGINDSLKRIVYAYQYKRRFDILDYQGNVIKKVIVSPNYAPVFNGKSIDYNKSMNCYFGLRSSKDSFFLYFVGHTGEDLMNDLNVKTYIEEFDWDGNPLNRYEINTFLWNFDLLKIENEVVGFLGLDQSSENPFTIFLL